MSVGSRIAQRRKELEMTQQTLADAMDVSFQSVGSWELGESFPEKERLPIIAKILCTTVPWLMEEDETEAPRWELHDGVFSVDHMKRWIRGAAAARKMGQTERAVGIMERCHAGMTRAGKDKLPYITHPLMMACHAFALDIAEDNLVAAILLHDVVEDCGVTVEELDVNEDIRETVSLVSFSEVEGLTHEESKRQYYEKIGRNRFASMVKLLDRCNNISTMATAFSKKKIAEYIEETEKYIFPILNYVKHSYREYYNAAFLLKYHMLSVMETLKHTL